MRAHPIVTFVIPITLFMKSAAKVRLLPVGRKHESKHASKTNHLINYKGIFMSVLIKSVALAALLTCGVSFSASAQTAGKTVNHTLPANIENCESFGTFWSYGQEGLLDYAEVTSYNCPATETDPALVYVASYIFLQNGQTDFSEYYFDNQQIKAGTTMPPYPYCGEIEETGSWDAEVSCSMNFTLYNKAGRFPTDHEIRAEINLSKDSRSSSVH